MSARTELSGGIDGRRGPPAKAEREIEIATLGGVRASADVGHEIEIPDGTRADLGGEIEKSAGAGAGTPHEIEASIGTRAEEGVEIETGNGAGAELSAEIEKAGGARAVSRNEIEAIDGAGAVRGDEIESQLGAPTPESGSERTEDALEIEIKTGFSRYRDLVTANLGLLASTWLSLHKQYQATILRAHHGSPALEPILTRVAADTKVVRESMGKELTKAIRGHVLYPWLKGARSTGVHVVRLIAVIGDPLRFPGRLCDGGHHLPVDWSHATCLVPVGEKGMKLSDMTPCGARVGETRRGTGVRSLWHYLGLHVVDGRSPQKRKGVQATWSPIGRSCVLQPEGIADQIVRHNKDPWRGIYDRTKERLREERGVVERSNENATEDGDSALVCLDGDASFTGGTDCPRESEAYDGAANPSGRGVVEHRTEVDLTSGDSALREKENGGTDSPGEIDSARGAANPSDAAEPAEIEEDPGVAQPAGGEAVEGGVIAAESGPLRPFQIDRLARKIAVKAFVGDLLVEWKRRVEDKGTG